MKPTTIAGPTKTKNIIIGSQSMSFGFSKNCLMSPNTSTARNPKTGIIRNGQIPGPDQLSCSYHCEVGFEYVFRLSKKVKNKSFFI